MNGNEMDMNESTANRSSMRQTLSDLMDGHADGACAGRVSDAWRSDAAARADWHLYHVIGDVLRTPELAPRVRGSASRVTAVAVDAPLGHDAASVDTEFLALFRERLAREPVVLAPMQPVASRADERADAMATRNVAASSSARAAWRAPVAVAAGFMAVAAVVVVTQLGGLGSAPSGPVMAAAPSSVAGAQVQAVSQQGLPASASPTFVNNDQRMVRDARLDQYLAAHRQFGALSGGVVRGVSAAAPER